MLANLGQQGLLYRFQEHLGQMPANMEGLVGKQISAGRVVQVQVSQRPLERVFLLLLATVPPDRFFKRQIVSGDDDDRMDGE